MAKKKSASVQRGQVKLREKKLKDGSSSQYYYKSIPCPMCLAMVTHR